MIPAETHPTEPDAWVAFIGVAPAVATPSFNPFVSNAGVVAASVPRRVALVSAVMFPPAAFSQVVNIHEFGLVVVVRVITEVEAVTALVEVPLMKFTAVASI